MIYLVRLSVLFLCGGGVLLLFAALGLLERCGPLMRWLEKRIG